MDKFINENLKNLDMNLLLSKGFIENDKLNKKYYTILNNYKILLESYLRWKLSLKEYDNKLRNSELLFVPIKSENMDFYQYYSTMGLKYIYLRNDLSIEKLSNEDIETLLKINLSELKTISDELLNLIERTYKNIIDNNKDNNIKQINCYGIDIESFWINSSELVFGVRYDEFADNQLDEDTWEENYFKQVVYIDNLIKEMSDKSSNTLGVKVNFLKYNDHTVKNSLMK